MKRIIAILFCVTAVGIIGILSTPAGAQQPLRSAENAALRYWMAFAQMNDSNISAADAIRMDAMLAGGSPWDEQTFGAFVEQNKAAIETMIRGTHLPYCDWGIEWRLGPEAPIANLPKARALARLNGLYVMRLASAGAYGDAVRANIAGIRFARQLSQNASFVGTLTAKSALIPQLELTRQLAASKHLSASDLKALRNALKELPEGGFDWSDAARIEGETLHSLLVTLSQERDQKGFYEKWFGAAQQPNFHAPSQNDLHELDNATALYAKLLGMSPEQAEVQLPMLQKKIAALDSVSRAGIPNPVRIVAARTEVVKAQRRTAEALGTP
jgi:hypothetical protein